MLHLPARSCVLACCTAPKRKSCSSSGLDCKILAVLLVSVIVWADCRPLACPADRSTVLFGTWQEKGTREGNIEIDSENLGEGASGLVQSCDLYFVRRRYCRPNGEIDLSHTMKLSACIKEVKVCCSSAAPGPARTWSCALLSTLSPLLMLLFH